MNELKLNSELFFSQFSAGQEWNCVPTLHLRCKFTQVREWIPNGTVVQLTNSKQNNGRAASQWAGSSSPMRESCSRRHWKFLTCRLALWRWDSAEINSIIVVVACLWHWLCSESSLDLVFSLLKLPRESFQVVYLQLNWLGVKWKPQIMIQFDLMTHRKIFLVFLERHSAIPVERKVECFSLGHRQQQWLRKKKRKNCRKESLDVKVELDLKTDPLLSGTQLKLISGVIAFFISSWSPE